ncbi:MAG: hypothetical protein GX250_01995 [Clostridiales bacterium]|nr:hypothetical protein [Clostridiales bacterium]
MNRKRKSRRNRRRKPVLPYILGTVFLLVAVVFSVKGLANNSASPSPTPSQTVETPKPSQAPDETPSIPTAPVITPEPTVDTGFETMTMKQDDIYQGKLVLINASHHYKFIDFENFVCLYNYKTDSYKVGDYDILFAEDAVPPLNRMLDDFYYNSGVKAVMAVSGHRTYEFQQYLFDKEVALVGAEEAALWVAQPGASEHHSGLAIDFSVYYDSGEYFDYDGTGDFAWINENCHRYGFIVRYSPDKQDITGIGFEPWHFRYIGIPHATKVTELGMCYEEYIDYLRDYSYENPLSIRTDEGEVYDTYFCEGLKVYVPKNSDYEISGNNVDGFIVTVKGS